MKPTHTDVKRSTGMTVQLSRPLQLQQGTHGGPVMSCIPYANPGSAEIYTYCTCPPGLWHT